MLSGGNYRDPAAMTEMGSARWQHNSGRAPAGVTVTNARRQLSLLRIDHDEERTPSTDSAPLRPKGRKSGRMCGEDTLDQIAS
jgi:hypothetical protein